MSMAISKKSATKTLRHKYYFKKQKLAPLRKKQKSFATLYLCNFATLQLLQKSFATLSLCNFAPLQQKLIFTT